MKRFSRTTRESGFTLVELLVVIIIIGILAAIAIPVYLNQRQRAHESAAKIEMRAINQVMETQRLGVGTYPNTYAGFKGALQEAGLADKMRSSAAGTSQGVFCVSPSAQDYAFVYWSPVVRNTNLSSASANNDKTWIFSSQGGLKQMDLTVTPGALYTSQSLCAEAGKAFPGNNQSHWVGSAPSGYIGWTYQVLA